MEKDKNKEHNADVFTFCTLPSVISANKNESIFLDHCTVEGICPPRRHKYRGNVQKPQGFHSYYNIMWDPRVYRSSSERRKQREAKECDKIRQKLFRDSRKVQKKHIETQELDGQALLHQEYQRYAKLKIFKLSSKDTEQFLSELPDETGANEKPGQKKLREFPVAPSVRDDLIDAGTDMREGDFFEFELEMQNIAERMVGRITKDAMDELLIEDEKYALEVQKKNWNRKREQAINDLKKMHKRREELVDEAARIRKKHEEDDALKELKAHQDATRFSEDFFDNLLSTTVARLQFSGYLGLTNEVVETELIPFLNSLVSPQVAQHHVACQLLDEILEKAVAKKSIREKTASYTGLEANFEGANEMYTLFKSFSSVDLGNE